MGSRVPWVWYRWPRKQIIPKSSRLKLVITPASVGENLGAIVPWSWLGGPPEGCSQAAGREAGRGRPPGRPPHLAASRRPPPSATGSPLDRPLSRACGHALPVSPASSLGDPWAPRLHLGRSLPGAHSHGCRPGGSEAGLRGLPALGLGRVRRVRGWARRPGGWSRGLGWSKEQVAGPCGRLP